MLRFRVLHLSKGTVSLRSAAATIVGLAGVETYADGALLRSVAVHQSMRGTGLGRALVERALDSAKEAGSREVLRNDGGPGTGVRDQP